MRERDLRDVDGSSSQNDFDHRVCEMFGRIFEPRDVAVGLNNEILRGGYTHPQFVSGVAHRLEMMSQFVHEELREPVGRGGYLDSDDVRIGLIGGVPALDALDEY